MSIASSIDHSFLKASTTVADIENICKEAKQFNFRAVCVPPLFVKMSRVLLGGTNIKLATVTGFPFGYSAIEAKLAETVLAIVDGADEIDMVMNIAAVKNADWQYLAKEINTVMTVIRSKEKAIKLIIEAALLSESEMITCCDIYGAAGIDWLKTSTGFMEGHASIETVRLLRKHLANPVKINAGGDIYTYDIAKSLLNAGADTISPSNSIEIVKEELMLN